ncbi:MAG TPA: transposase [Gammaproteobacteria bacterium]|nr:transposase [Gammaproteobacteria bacterium]
MSHYRRAQTAGGCYFFTVVSYHRKTILCDDIFRNALRIAIEKTRQQYPFKIDAWVLMPDHLHCVWTLPKGDANFSVRWGKIKRYVSIACRDHYTYNGQLSISKKKHRESTVWQRRFWEHQIRDQEDFHRHIDYIHYNPVKHGLCEAPIQWPYSTFQRYVREGKYPWDWALRDSAVEGLQCGE